MHKCVRCSKTASSIGEINAGCSCGSKAFVFTRDSKGGELKDEDPLSSESQKTKPADVSSPAAEPENGKAPSSYFSRTTFTTEDVENIKIVTEGVFAVDLNALSKNPVVLKDEEGIYYVRLPFDQNGKKETTGRKESKKKENGKKK